MRKSFEAQAERARAESMSHEHYLLCVAECEMQARRENRVAKLLQESRLPREKTMENFDRKRLPTRIAQQLPVLLDAGFLDRRENILAFGNPGSGKTHLLAVVGHELVRQGRPVLFTTCSNLVQELLRAKRDLKLERTLKKLRCYDALILDDIRYVQHNRDEMEVLFALLADRYERGSILQFSKWETIFKDPMTTAAAIDRRVHHSIILELNVKSYRLETAGKKKGDEKPHATPAA
jgi:DNA replication protein DnaC